MTQPYTLPDILDNSGGNRTMTTAINALLPNTSDLRIATGFFNLGGYTLLRDGLSQAQMIRILLGKEPTASEAADVADVDLETFSDELAGDLSEALSPGKREAIERVTHFLNFLKRQDVFFRLYRRRFFHAKAYILDGVPMLGAVALVGSSNFTTAGLTGNTELNLAQKQVSAINELKAWFERFWIDEQSKDYKQALIDLYTRATDLYPPYMVYMKSLWETLSDKLGNDLMPPDGDRPSPILLADFQHDGYAAAKQILETYNGVIIADPVGLGKTFLALRLLDDYAYQLRQKAIVVCPAQLRDPVWRRNLDAFRIYAEVISQESVSQTNFPFDQYADADLIVVDECHNFRNPHANRWSNIYRLLTTGKPKKLILLTATPINTSVFDLYNQLRLITKDRSDYFAGVGIGNLFNYFREVEANRERLFDLLETISVRRSRSFIRDNYPHAIIDGQKVHFPERMLHTVNYNLQQTYEGLYTEVVGVIENLRLAPYLLEFFRNDIPRQLRLVLTGEGSFEGVSGEQSFKLGRQMSLANLMRLLYLKRLESSVYALQLSLKRARRFQERFLEQLRAGRLLDPSSFQKTEVILRELDDIDDLRDEERAEAEGAVEVEIDNVLIALSPVNAADYDVAAIQTAVEHDVQELTRILNKLEPLTQTQDDKLVALKNLLTTDLRNHKVILFSYFRDTARYLYRSLQADPEFLKALGHHQIAFAYSGFSPQERRERIERFAPKANKRPELVGTEQEIQLLISTDILSEGQNLQDADVVINYDLHWNPVRMVQRAGRIDRLGSDFDQIHLYNFIPEDALENLLLIVQRLRTRLEAINRAGLLDAAVMAGEVPTPQDFNALRRIVKEEGEILGELENLSDLDIGEFLKQELLDFLKRMGEKVLSEMLPFAGSSKRGNGRRGLFVHYRSGTQHFQMYYDLVERKWENSRLEALKIARCTETEPLVPPDFDFYPIVEDGKKRIVGYLRQAQLKLPALLAPQNHLVNQLKSLRPDRNPVAREMLTYFSQPLPAPQLKRLKRIWDQHRTDTQTLLEALQIFVSDNPPVKVGRPEIPQLTEDELQVVCYMALV